MRLGTQLWIWRGICLDLPRDWELLQFSKRRDVGSVTFADRYRCRLQMHWHHIDGEPDMRRMVKDHAAKLLESNPDATVRIKKSGLWTGVEVVTRDGAATRYSRYFLSEGLLVECVFPQAAEPSVIVDEREILARLQPSGEEGRWVAFGMDLAQPVNTHLKSCQVQPGLAVMVFCGDGCTPIHYRFSRRGMLQNWLCGSVEEWMVLQAPRNLLGIEHHLEFRDGHEVRFLTGTFRKKPPGGWRKKKQNYRAAAWICPQDGRLFHEEISGPGDLPEPRALSCCAGQRRDVHA